MCSLKVVLYCMYKYATIMNAISREKKLLKFFCILSGQEVLPVFIMRDRLLYIFSPLKDGYIFCVLKIIHLQIHVEREEG